MLASASPSFVISKIKSSINFFGVNFDNAWSLNLRLMRTLGVERSSEKICYVLVPLFTNILAVKKLLQIKKEQSDFFLPSELPKILCLVCRLP